MNELVKSLKESLPKAIISNEVKINRYENVFYIDGYYQMKTLRMVIDYTLSIRLQYIPMDSMI